MSDKTCSFEGCGRALKARGLCDGHWQQDRAGKTLTPLKPKSPNNPVPLRRRTTQAGEVRTWARENGIDVPHSGIIPSHIMELWRNR